MKKILKYIVIAVIIYGIYKLIQAFPVESIIGLGSIAMFIIFYWIMKVL